MTFDEFVAFRLGALLRYATVVTCDAHLAEDITQDVLVRAQARWERISAVDAPERYVKRMVLNEFLSWRRRRPARVIIQPLAQPGPPGIGHGWVVVDLASGLTLTVFGSVPDVSRDDLIATAAAVAIGTVPDLSWLGS